MAFHPRFAQNGIFHVYYNRGNLFSRVSEFAVSVDPDAADPAIDCDSTGLILPVAEYAN